VINILIEGSDGVGKSTLGTNLRRKINADHPDYHAVNVAEPGNSIPGLRELFLNPSSSLRRTTSALLATASAAQTEASLEAIENITVSSGRKLVVIRDRSVISTMVYQGIDNPMEINHVDIFKMYNAMIGIKFDVTLVLHGLETDDGSNDVHTKFGHSKRAREGYQYVVPMLLNQVSTHDYQEVPVWVADAVNSYPTPRNTADAAEYTFPNYHRVSTSTMDQAGTLEYAYEAVRHLLTPTNEKVTT
jgi:thymidylate kinase